MNRLRVAFAPYWQSIQHALFPQGKYGALLGRERPRRPSGNRGK